MLEYHKKELHDDILKYCFWDYKITLETLEKYISSDDWRLKKFVFEKIFCNSPMYHSDLMVFEKEDLLKLIAEYKVPQFNYEYLNKRHLIVRQLIVGEKVIVPGLEWKI